MRHPAWQRPSSAAAPQARLLRLLGAYLVALGGSALPGGEAVSLATQPLPRVPEPGGEAVSLATQPLPRVPEPAPSSVADSPPFERAGPLGGQRAGGGEAGCPQAQGRLGRRPGSLPQVRRVGGAPPLPAAVGLKGVVAEGAQSNCGCRGVPRRTVGCPSRPGPLRIYSQRNQANGWFHDWFTRDSSLW